MAYRGAWYARTLRIQVLGLGGFEGLGLRLRGLELKSAGFRALAQDCLCRKIQVPY